MKTIIVILISYINTKIFINNINGTDYEPGLLGNMEDTPKIVRLENNPGYMMKNDPGTLHSSFSWSDATPQEVASR